MKKSLVLVASLLAFAACKNDKEAEKEVETPQVEETVNEETAVNYETFGEKIVADNALSEAEMLEAYKNLKAGDTVEVKFKSTIKDVCQKKGCWMSMELPGEEDSFIRFKDYGFFVPLNAGEQEAVVEGKAFISETSVAELKHYAKDEGKSQEEIDKITEPEITYGFMANGVLIAQ